jgi:hypothetical protein
MNEETSESGSPIHRYQPRKNTWEPADMSDSSMEKISNHIETHVGPISMVWHEVLSDLVHIDVHEVAPTADRPFWTLVTSGMSDLPMHAPAGCEDRAFAELMICLPKDWKMSQDDFKNERYYWPVRWLKILARFPHEYKTWLSWGHTMPNGDPAQILHETVPFDCMLLLRPKTVSTDFWQLPVRNNKTIHFLALFPLYPGETILKLKKSADEIESRFERQKISEILDSKRRDVSKNEWWKLW